MYKRKKKHESKVSTEVEKITKLNTRQTYTKPERKKLKKRKLT